MAGRPLSEILVEIRTRLFPEDNLSEFARRLKVRRPSLYAWERGTTKPTDESLEKYRQLRVKVALHPVLEDLLRAMDTAASEAGVQAAPEAGAPVQVLTAVQDGQEAGVQPAPVQVPARRTGRAGGRRTACPGRRTGCALFLIPDVLPTCRRSGAGGSCSLVSLKPAGIDSLWAVAVRVRKFMGGPCAAQG